jgi:hypothetical protein
VISKLHKLPAGMCKVLPYFPCTPHPSRPYTSQVYTTPPTPKNPRVTPPIIITFLAHPLRTQLPIRLDASPDSSDATKMQRRCERSISIASMFYWRCHRSNACQSTQRVSNEHQLARETGMDALSGLRGMKWSRMPRTPPI